MVLTRKGFFCDGCGELLARGSAGGPPMRPRWPGYEVPTKAPDGQTYMVMKCASCDGPPPPTTRQMAILLPLYLLGVTMAVLAIGSISGGELQLALYQMLAGLGVLSFTMRLRHKWGIRRARGQ